MSQNVTDGTIRVYTPDNVLLETNSNIASTGLYGPVPLEDGNYKAIASSATDGLASAAQLFTVAAGMGNTPNPTFLLEAGVDTYIVSLEDVMNDPIIENVVPEIDMMPGYNNGDGTYTFSKARFNRIKKGKPVNFKLKVLNNANYAALERIVNTTSGSSQSVGLIVTPKLTLNISVRDEGVLGNRTNVDVWFMKGGNKYIKFNLVSGGVYQASLWDDLFPISVFSQTGEIIISKNVTITYDYDGVVIFSDTIIIPKPAVKG
jgi:hypothetical protein